MKLPGMTLKRPHETFVHTDDDLFMLWRDLMGAGGFARRSLWMIFFYRDGELAPAITPIDDIPGEPDPAVIGSLARVVEGVVADLPGSVAFLLSRPGPEAMSEEDRRWARALRDTVDPALSPWPVHLATHDRVQVFAPDDLIAA